MKKKNYFIVCFFIMFITISFGCENNPEPDNQNNQKEIEEPEDQLNDQKDTQETETNLDFGESYKKLSNIVDKKFNATITIRQSNTELSRKHTTQKINGNEISRITFYVSSAKNNYADNLYLTTTIVEELNTLYPNLSRGIVRDEEVFKENSSNDSSALNLEIGVGGIANNSIENAKAIHKLIESIEQTSIKKNLGSLN